MHGWMDGWMGINVCMYALLIVCMSFKVYNVVVHVL